MFDNLRKIFKSKDGYSADEKLQSKTTVIAIVNQKGGCGKTTTCINLSGALAKKGFKVLIIDLDPQSNASLGIGVHVSSAPASVYDVLVKGADLERVILNTYDPNLDIVPASSMMTGVQLEIADVLGRERLLRSNIYRMINSRARYYDYIIMDCSPSLDLLTVNGLVAAQRVLIPIQVHYFSLEGMKELFSTIQVVKDRLNSSLEILGILPALIDLRMRMSMEVLAQVRDYFKEKVFRTFIHLDNSLIEATAHGRSVFDTDPSSDGAKDYWALADEVIALTRYVAVPPPVPVPVSNGAEEAPKTLHEEL